MCGFSCDATGSCDASADGAASLCYTGETFGWLQLHISLCEGGHRVGELFQFCIPATSIPLLRFEVAQVGSLNSYSDLKKNFESRWWKRL